MPTSLKRFDATIAAHRHADEMGQSYQRARLSVGQTAQALQKKADEWSYTRVHFEGGHLQEGVRLILKHAYCKGPWRDRLMELQAAWEAAVAEQNRTKAVVEALPDLLPLRNELRSEMNERFAERVKFIRDRVFPIVRPYCRAEEWETADQVAERIVHELPRLKDLHLKQKYADLSKSETINVEGMIGILQHLEQTRAADEAE